jgi:hypothetical protein
MELLIALLAVVGGLIVAAAVIDLKARRRKIRYSIDPGSVRDHRRIADAHSSSRDMGGTGL